MVSSPYWTFKCMCTLQRWHLKTTTFFPSNLLFTSKRYMLNYLDDSVAKDICMVVQSLDRQQNPPTFSQWLMHLCQRLELKTHFFFFYRWLEAYVCCVYAVNRSDFTWYRWRCRSSTVRCAKHSRSGCSPSLSLPPPSRVAGSVFRSVTLGNVDRTLYCLLFAKHRQWHRSCSWMGGFKLRLFVNETWRRGILPLNASDLQSLTKTKHWPLMKCHLHPLHSASTINRPTHGAVLHSL